MFKFYFLLALLSSEINGIYGGAFMFTQKPNPFVYFMNGSNAVVEWKYSVDNRMADFQYITWDVEVGGQSTPVMIENATGHLRYTAAYAGRVEKRGQATLVLKDVTFKDSGIYLKCFLIHTSRRQNVSSTRLTITGHASLQPQAQFASFLGSVVFICNATNVPKESFSWLKRHGQTRMMLVDNGQNVTINSAIGSSILTLKNVAEYNKGYYTCDATANVDQSNFVESYLQLPETLKLDGTFSSGRPIFAAVNETQKTLCCPVIGYPPPIVTWEKNGTMLQTGENKCFTIASVKSGHFGNYSCIATDGKTTTDPFVLSLVEKEEPVPDQLTISVIHGTTGTPATLKWKPLTGATYYVVNVDGSDIYGDTVIGARTSLEIHYNTLVMLKGDVDPPKETEICADVIAFSSEAVVIGKAPKCQKLMVKKPVDV